MTYQEAVAKCEEADQMHLLKFYEELGQEEKEALLSEIRDTDFTVVKRAVSQSDKKGEITPIKALTQDEIKEKEAKIKSKTSEARAERRGKLADKADK